MYNTDMLTGKVVQTPEVCRVYLGSFWDAPLKLEENRYQVCMYVGEYSTLVVALCRVLLEREKRDLINEMMSLPKNAVVRRINELVKRSRSVKVSRDRLHAHYFYFKTIIRHMNAPKWNNYERI